MLSIHSNIFHSQFISEICEGLLSVLARRTSENILKSQLSSDLEVKLKKSDKKSNAGSSSHHFISNFALDCSSWLWTLILDLPLWLCVALPLCCLAFVALTLWPCLCVALPLCCLAFVLPCLCVALPLWPYLCGLALALPLWPCLCGLAFVALPLWPCLCGFALWPKMN